MTMNPRLTTGCTYSTPAAASTRAKVLVVENNPSTAEIEVLVLAAAGHEVLTTANAQHALTTFYRWHPDLILLELALPDLPGPQLCRQLRQRSAIPIIAVSLDGHPDDIQAAYAAGVSDYLPKPFGPRELLERIQLRLAPTHAL